MKPILKMAHRAISPAVSDNELDISRILLLEAKASETEGISKRGKSWKTENLNMMDDDADGVEDEETFIAAQQAAANRKASKPKRGPVTT